MKSGTRLKSQVCATQVIVVRPADSLADLRAGGVPMVELDAADAELHIRSDLAGGNELGKRYVSEDGAEILVTKAGTGTLTVGETALTVKAAKPLPASD